MWFNVLVITLCHSVVFCTLPLGPCTPFPLCYICSNTPDFLKMMNFFRNHFSFVYCGFLGPPTLRMKPLDTLPFATVLIISLILRADFVFSTAIFAFHFWPVITGGWVFFTSGLRESRSIWKSRALPNLSSSISDNVGSFSFVVELYKFIKSVLSTIFSYIY